MTIKKYETHISHVGMLLEEFQEEVTSNKSICGTSIPEIVPTELSKLQNNSNVEHFLLYNAKKCIWN